MVALISSTGPICAESGSLDLCHYHYVLACVFFFFSPLHRWWNDGGGVEAIVVNRIAIAALCLHLY